MERFSPSLIETFIAATAFKLLLFPAYKSTDFEVHRNWLAITHTLPVKLWYFEKTSEWTLDYPPLFAVFEWLLSQVAHYFDPEMLKIKNLNHSSPSTVLFQRLSVVFTELVLVFALHKLVATAPGSFKRSAHAVALSLLLSPGLLIIDHIHFQYNGFMYGILLLSLILARSPTTRLAAGLLFAVLLCFKHIYLYLAPAYFVYLLRTYCLGPKFDLSRAILDIQLTNCIKLIIGVVGIFGSVFGPFIYWQQLPQLITRLFPFSRGLCHAYWAPNVWALYSFVDRVLIYVAPQLGLHVNSTAVNSVTRGLVGDTTFAVLPEVTPRATFLLTLVFQILPLVKLFVKPTFVNFIGAVTLCGYSSFLFGWHVHEKAILLVIFPFSLLALKDRQYFSTFRPLAVAGHVSLFPLLFTAPEFPIKTVYTITWLIVFLISFDNLVGVPISSGDRSGTSTSHTWLLDRPATLYIVISIPLIAYCSLIHGVLFGKNDKYEYLPLMLTSSYSALGVLASWAGFCWLYFTT